MFETIRQHPDQKHALCFTGTPAQLHEHFKSSEDCGFEIAGFVVSEVSTEGQHDGKPAVRINLADDFGKRDVGRLVIQSKSGYREASLEWTVWYASDEDAAETFKILSARRARPKISTVREDFAYGDDSETLDEALAMFTAKYGVAASVVDIAGPGGGWPVIEIFGLTENVEKALIDAFGYDSVEVAERLG